MITHSLLRLLTAPLVLFSTFALAQAQTTTNWTGNEDAQWEDPDNWSAGVPVDSNFHADFPAGGSNRDIELTEARSIHGARFTSTTSTDYTFSGEQLTLTSTVAGLDGAFRFQTGVITFNNNIHLGASDLQVLDFNVTAEQTANVTFAGTITSAGDLQTFQRSSAGTISVTMSGNFASAVAFDWRSASTAGVPELILEGTNQFSTLSVGTAGQLHIQLASNGALAANSFLANTNATIFQVEAIGQGRVYDANLILSAPLAGESTFIGDHTLTLTGNVDLRRVGIGGNAINVTAPRVELTGNWVQPSGQQVREMQKLGDGTLVMGANGTTTHTYTGVTNVNAGTLLINGQLQSADNGVEVHNDATLGGIGTIRRNTTIASTAFLSPGDEGAGVLTFQNTNLTLDGTLLIELGGTGAGQYDRLSLIGTGDWNFSDSDLALSLIDGFEPGLGNQFTIVTSDQNLGSDFWGSQVVVGAFLFDVDYAAGGGNDIMLTVAVIPEPSPAALLLGLGLGLLLLRARSRRRCLSRA